MLKRTLAALLLAASLLTLGGCGSLFETEYFSASSYEEPDSGDDDTTEIHNYSALLRALSAMVADYETERVLVFGDYSGIIADDLSTACWEVRSNTALGAYCVESIAYELEQVVAYCEADVTVTYKRTADEVKSIDTVQTRSGIAESVVAALTEQRSTLAVQINTDALDESDVSALVETACLNHPLLAVDVPRVDITMYTGGTQQKIFEITLSYSISQDEITARRAALDERLQALTATLDATADDAALRAAVALAEACPMGGGATCTAYEALVDGATDSRGLAMAYKAVCDALDISCQVVAGRYDSAAHYWNLVQLSGNTYHLDLAGYSGTLWLQPDSDIWGRYWWDTDSYPACTSQGFSWRPGQELAVPETKNS